MSARCLPYQVHTGVMPLNSQTFLFCPALVVPYSFPTRQCPTHELNYWTTCVMYVHTRRDLLFYIMLSERSRLHYKYYDLANVKISLLTTDVSVLDYIISLWNTRIWTYKVEIVTSRFRNQSSTNPDRHEAHSSACHCWPSHPFRFGPDHCPTPAGRCTG